MEALEFTILFIKIHGLRSILLAPRLKRPPTGKFPITEDPAEIRRHVSSGGNVGILGGQVAILDFDNMELANQMLWSICPLEPTVMTGSGKLHCYVRLPQPLLTARIRWKGEPVGEIQKGENQYVVAPPSIHPNGERYQWKRSDPLEPIPLLPPEWYEYLNNEMTPEVPEWAKKYVDQGMPEEEAWKGPDAATLLARAGAMPRSKRRNYGIKFRCPACAEDGHDKSYDNAIVFSDGRWACAYAPGDPEHKIAIGKALGFNLQHSQDDVDEMKRLTGA